MHDLTDILQLDILKLLVWIVLKWFLILYWHLLKRFSHFRFQDWLPYREKEHKTYPDKTVGKKAESCKQSIFAESRQIVKRRHKTSYRIFARIFLAYHKSIEKANSLTFSRLEKQESSSSWLSCSFQNQWCHFFISLLCWERKYINLKWIK